MSLRARLARESQSSQAARMPLTAMIDVVFLLLIFFLFGSFDFGEQQVVAALSQTGAAPGPTEQTLWLRVRRTPGQGVSYAVDRGGFTEDLDLLRESLATRLSSAPETPVVVDPQPGVTLQQLIDTLALARSSGAQRVSLRVEDDNS